MDFTRTAPEVTLLQFIVENSLPEKPPMRPSKLVGGTHTSPRPAASALDACTQQVAPFCQSAHVRKVSADLTRQLLCLTCRKLDSTEGNFCMYVFKFNLNSGVMRTTPLVFSRPANSSARASTAGVSLSWSSAMLAIAFWARPSISWPNLRHDAWGGLRIYKACATTHPPRTRPLPPPFHPRTASTLLCAAGVCAYQY